MIEAVVTYNSKLTEIERRFAIPLLEVAQQLVPGMVSRIRQGQSSTGRFSALGAHSTPRPGPGLFWAPPGSKQPPGALAKPTDGQWAGWAGYESYRAYTQALGSPARDFSDSGALLAALKIRVNGPGRVKVAFFGAHPPSSGQGAEVRRQANSAVAYLASRMESVPMLTPSRGEIEDVARQFQSEVAAQMVGEAASAQEIRGLGQRATRLEKRLSAQASGRR